MIISARWMASCLVVLLALIPFASYALTSDNEGSFERLLNQSGLTLDTPSQQPLIRLLINPKLLIGQKTYIVGLQSVEPTKSPSGYITLMIEFPPLSGPPGAYIVILKKPTKRERLSYDCVVKVDDVLMVPTEPFLQDIEVKLRQGIYRDPMIWYAVPFRGKEYAVPVVSEVECLP